MLNLLSTIDGFLFNWIFYRPEKTLKVVPLDSEYKSWSYFCLEDKGESVPDFENYKPKAHGWK